MLLLIANMSAGLLWNFSKTLTFHDSFFCVVQVKNNREANDQGQGLVSILTEKLPVVEALLRPVFTRLDTQSHVQ